jgi:hypothetical protein
MFVGCMTGWGVFVVFPERQANLEVDLTGTERGVGGVAGVVKVCTASMQCLCGCCGKAPLWDVGAVIFLSFLYISDC